MAIPSTNLLSVLAVWPVLKDDGFDPTLPSPWRGIGVPATTHPLQPIIAILFNHPINPALYASNAALSAAILLTSVTDPGARNIDTFTNVKFDPISNVLTFQPASPLVAGSTYGATVRSRTRDAAGRSLERAYYWEFEVELSAYQGIPIPVLISPADQTVVTLYPFSLQWGMDHTYTTIPSGQSLVFVVTVYDTREKNNILWTGAVFATDTYIAPSSGSLSTAYNLYKLTPQFSPNSIPDPGILYWSVQAQLRNVNTTVVSESPETALQQFLLDSQETGLVPTFGGPGGLTWDPLIQKNPLVPVQTFRLLGVLPYPGYVNQDAMPASD